MALLTYSPNRQLEDFESFIRNRTKRLSSAVAAMAAGSVEFLAIEAVRVDLRAMSSSVAAIVLVPGIAQVAKNNHDNQSYAPGTEANALKVLCDTAAATIEAAIPASGGYLLVSQYVSGALTPRTFTPAQTATIRTQVQAVIDAVDITG